MRYLLYCIFHNRADFSPENVLGVEGQPVSVIAANGFSAALSDINNLELTCALSEILTYHKVIESFHRHCTVIPLRYGCLFREKSQIIAFLERQGGHFKTLLRELKGCTEMGIRILTFNSETMTPLAPVRISHSTPDNLQQLDSGRAYLAARKTHYERIDHPPNNNNEIVERCRAAFADLSVKCKVESPPFNLQHSVFSIPLFSLYFLVPKSSVKDFRKVFRQVSAKETTTKLLLSGPWPPYNFV